jgi:hypothetical protein
MVSTNMIDTKSDPSLALACLHLHGWDNTPCSGLYASQEAAAWIGSFASAAGYVQCAISGMLHGIAPCCGSSCARKETPQRCGICRTGRRRR